MNAVKNESFAEPPSGWQTRFNVIGLCFFATLICYIDRVNISIAVIPMAADLGWDQTLRGLVLSAFFYGYLATQILGGWLSDKFGGKIVLGIAVLTWSFFTVITPPAALAGVATLLLARIGMGLGEGLAFPAIYSLYARWVPPVERGRAAALNFSGTSFGTIVALLATPLIVVKFGWQWVFYIFGALGFFWFAAWRVFVTDGPDSHPKITQSEKSYIERDQTIAPKQDKDVWRILLSKRPVWALILNHFCFTWGFYVILTWLPTYINEGLGVEVSAVGYYAVVPFIANVAGFTISGILADRMIRKGVSISRVRKIMQIICFGGPAAALVLINWVTDAETAMAVMTAALFLAGFAAGGFLVNHLDIAPRHAGVLMGITNTAATLPGIIGVTVTGMILDASGSWALVFSISALLYLLGLILWLLFASGERIIE